MSEKILSVSESLRELMNENDITCPMLARRIGVSAQTVRNWVNGNLKPNLENTIALADFFGCSADYLLGRTMDDSVFSPKPCPPFYPRLTELLKQRGFSMYFVEQETRITHSHFEYWRNGHNPSINSLSDLAAFLDVSIDFLIGREL